MIRWRKSTYSNGENTTCVELARLPGAIAVRDSKNTIGPQQRYSITEITAFLAEVKAGRHDTK